jgi:hypothetical protein
MCLSMGKAIIIATNMLESMNVHPTSTSAEVLDIVVVVLEGADAIMLYGETTHEKYVHFSPTFLLASYIVTHVTHINTCIVGDTSVLCTCICGHSTNQSCCAYQPGCELKGYPSMLCQAEFKLGTWVNVFSSCYLRRVFLELFATFKVGTWVNLFLMLLVSIFRWLCHASLVQIVHLLSYMIQSM